ncbi:MAG: cell division protein FtsQ, partial [Treponema sp.]|nr:cell division protein FtsQ [Treponema sp.]
RLAGHYLVESAKVVKRFPDRLSVFLEPRRAVAMALAKVNGRTRPVYLDRFGVLFRASGEEGPLSSMPVLSGVFGADQQLWLGTRLSAPFLPLMERIGSISDEDPKIWQTISEISIAEKSGDLYDLVLYPVDNSIRLRMGGDISKEGIYYALLMLDVCRQFGDSAPEEIDVRSGLGVYKVKESRFGE